MNVCLCGFIVLMSANVGKMRGLETKNPTFWGGILSIVCCLVLSLRHFLVSLLAAKQVVGERRGNEE